MQWYLLLAIIASLSSAAAIMKPIYDALRAPADERSMLYAFIATPFVISLLTVWLQFYNITQVAEREKIKRDGELAFALWAFRNNEVAHLRTLARAHQFLLGYWYFKQNSFDNAQVALRQSIRDRDFIAPSHYILAEIERRQIEASMTGDLTEVLRRIDLGLANNPGYSPLYLQRALVRARQREINGAIHDFKTAVYDEPAHCTEIDTALARNQHPFRNLLTEPKFRELMVHCKNIDPRGPKQ